MAFICCCYFCVVDTANAALTKVCVCVCVWGAGVHEQFLTVDTHLSARPFQGRCCCCFLAVGDPLGALGISGVYPRERECVSISCAAAAAAAHQHPHRQVATNSFTRWSAILSGHVWVCISVYTMSGPKAYGAWGGRWMAPVTKLGSSSKELAAHASLCSSRAGPIPD